jgi:hypothetical protein
MQNANQVQTGAKKMKVNPAQEFIGVKLTSQDAIKVNYRQGKANVITCNHFQCLGANHAVRRFTLVFKDAQGTELMTRRVYKEHFEKMADKFGVDLF